MKKGCLVVKMEVLANVFGERFWNDVEDIRCIPTDRIDANEKNRLKSKFDIQGIDNVKYLIGETW